MSASYPLPHRSDSGGGQLNPLRFPAEVATSQSGRSLRWLTDDLLFYHQRCNRRTYLDLYGNPRHKDPPSDYLQKLRQDSSEHRRTVMQDYDPCHAVYPKGDWAAGAKATQLLMEAGVDAIANAVVITEAASGDVQLVSRPDLLVKLPGWSRWGDWVYAPIDIKLGKKPKLDYQVVAAFHAYVLSRSQWSWPPETWLALRDGRQYSVDMERQLPKLQETLNGCLRDLQGATPPEPFIAHSRCDLCHWFSHCYGQAQETQHLSLLPGVTPARYRFLQEVRLTTVEALAQVDPKYLAPMPGFGEPVAAKLIHQARAMLGNCAIPRHHSEGFPLSPKDLPCSDVELYFDIEAAPDQDLIYLHGVLVVDYREQTENFHALVAETPEKERHAWESFLELVHQYPNAPIYHFCPYEAQTVRKLGDLYGADEAVIDPLLQRFYDIHKSVVDSVTLPIESYALKHIARWIGFDWRDEGANGAQSICWYNAWLDTCDRTYLNAILRYNEDDCRATYRIKDWLVKFAQPFWK